MSPQTDLSNGELKANSPERETFAAFVRLTLRKRAIEAEAKQIAAQLKMLEPQILAHLGEAGYDKISVDGYTVSPHREPWVYPADGQDRQSVIAALRACDLEQYIIESYSTRSLTKYVKDMEIKFADQIAGGEISSVFEVLPPPLARVVKVAPSYRVNVMRTYRHG